MTATTKLIYGTAWKKERTTALVVQAVLHGFRAIDTACQPKHYREDLVGEALSILYDKHGFKREDLFIQTKYTPISGQDTSKPLPYDPQTPIEAQIQASLSTSLCNLRTTYIDSYLLHSPLPTLPETLEAWHTLIQLQSTGQVRRIGISNAYDTRLLARLSKEQAKPDVVQNRWYQGNGWDRGVVMFCREMGVEYQSFWTLTGSPELIEHPVVRQLVERQAGKLTPEQIVYAFALGEGVRPISGTTSEKHMDDDVHVAEITLEEEEELVKELRAFVWGP
ncbi:Aldo/keto reductase [Amanita rubescens]|nr:Aldo/keto reductase [Amanita rubescens]